MVTDTQDKKIPAGYKQTEVGVIPSDWKVKKLGEVADITKLAGFEYSKYFNSYKDGGEIIVVRGTNITQNKLDLADIKTIPRSTSNNLQRSKLNKGDLVFAYVGTIGPVYLIEENDRFHLGPNTSKITVRNDINPNYVFSYFTSWLLKKEIIEYTSVGAQPSLSMTKIRNFRIILPPTKQEQTAIASVLSDVDALIDALEKLIAKKHAMKQGAMQELLTGKRRLSGFREKWNCKPISDVAPLQRGFDLPTRQLRTGNVPVVYSNGILNHHNKAMVAGPGVVTGRSGTIGKVNYIETDYWPHNTTLWVTSFKGNDPKFIYYLYQFIGLERFGTGSGVPTLNRNDVHAFRVAVPPPSEQTAIVAVFCDMDSEIVVLEQKLAKYKALKQGMMQMLLTGKIRLPH